MSVDISIEHSPKYGEADIDEEISSTASNSIDACRGDWESAVLAMLSATFSRDLQKGKMGIMGNLQMMVIRTNKIAEAAPIVMSWVFYQVDIVNSISVVPRRKTKGKLEDGDPMEDEKKNNRTGGFWMKLVSEIWEDSGRR